MSTLVLSGRLGFGQVGGVLAGAEALLAAGTVDLSGVEQADSAGLALLLELTRRARASGRPLRLVGAPAQLRGLAGFFGLEPILQLEA